MVFLENEVSYINRELLGRRIWIENFKYDDFNYFVLGIKYLVLICVVLYFVSIFVFVKVWE